MMSSVTKSRPISTNASARCDDRLGHLDRGARDRPADHDGGRGGREGGQRDAECPHGLDRAAAAAEGEKRELREIQPQDTEVEHEVEVEIRW